VSHWLTLSETEIVNDDKDTEEVGEGWGTEGTTWAQGRLVRESGKVLKNESLRGGGSGDHLQ
jgi:hypothetical protein